MKTILLPLLLLLAFVPMMAQAGGNTFDPATNVLEMPFVQTPDASYTGVKVQINDYTVLDAKVAVEVPPDFHDGNGGTIGILPNGHTCFLGVTPGCEENENWQGFDPGSYQDPEPDPGPTPCGFGPARPECR